MQLYKYDTSRDGTYRQAGGRSVDAALLVEELTEIYSTPTPPTPKGWREAEKNNCIDWLVVSLQWQGSNIYTQNINMNPTQIRLITILVVKENIPKLR